MKKINIFTPYNQHGRQLIKFQPTSQIKERHKMIHTQTETQTNLRWRFYREHKFVTFKLFEFDAALKKTNFSELQQVQNVKEQFDGIHMLMEGHAKHEDDNIHSLLRAKNSTVHLSIESEHKQHEKVFKNLIDHLDTIIKMPSPIERIKEGYGFYLAYRSFLAENLQHLNAEEATVMPELHRLYPDEELRKVEFATYHKMEPDQMVHMMKVLFPEFNADDREQFLVDIKESEPEKFIAAWEDIAPEIEENERNILIQKLGINKNIGPKSSTTTLFYPWEKKSDQGGEDAMTFHERRLKKEEETKKANTTVTENNHINKL